MGISSITWIGSSGYCSARQYGPQWEKIVWKLQIADPDFGLSFQYSRWMATLAFLGFVVLLLFLFLRNFRSGERGTLMARKQLPWVAVYAVLSMVLLRGGQGVLEWWLLTH